MNKILTKERVNAMTIKKIIAALISAAIAMPLCTSPALADVPPAVGFDNGDDTAVEGFGDIVEEKAFGSENDPNDLYNNSVDMGYDDETEDGDALLFENDNEQLINWMAQTPSPSSSPSPTAPPKKTKLVNGSFEWPFITPEMLDKVTGSTMYGMQTSGGSPKFLPRWFSLLPNQYNDYLKAAKTGSNTTSIDYAARGETEFGWKTSAFVASSGKQTGVIELVSKKYNTNDPVTYRGESIQYKHNNQYISNSHNSRIVYSTENFAADDGDQCAELCGRDQSSLYQVLDTFEGEHLTWKLSHIARHYDTNINMLDAMALFIGPAEDLNTYYSKKDKTKGGIASTNRSNNTPFYDLFLWMGEAIYKNNIGQSGVPPLFPTTANNDRDYTVQKNYDDFVESVKDTDGNGRKEPKSYNIYVHPLANDCINQYTVVRSRTNTPDGKPLTITALAPDATELAEGTYLYTDLVSTSYVEGWQRWSCWIMTDTGLDWGRYEGVYDVPAGQSASTFAFTALSGKEASGFVEGNLIDGIEFEAQYPLQVTATNYGHGNVGTAGTYVDISQPFPNENHAAGYNNFADGDEVTITAKADDGNSFNGAYIDNVFYHSSNREVFSETVDGTYTMEVTMDRGHAVQLVFAKPYSVMYEPNGGVFDGKSTITTKDMGDGKPDTDNKLLETYTVAASPVPDDGTVQFTGWYFPNAETVIQPGHTVEYIHDRTALENRLSQIDADYASTVDNLDEPKFIVRFALAGDPNTAPKYYVCLPAEQGLNFIAQWAYKQEIIPMTKGPNDMTYTESSAGGTVSIFKNGEQVQSGDFAYQGDKITVKAEENTTPIGYNNSSVHYRFVGFYEDAAGRIPVSAVDAYSYVVYGSRKLYARFCAEIQYPYLSFISENADVLTNSPVAGTDFERGSHVGTNAGENNMNTLNNEFGNSDFGNTISTGFIATTRFNSDYSDAYCYWEIDIPIDGTTYFKKSNSYKNAEDNGVENSEKPDYPFDDYLENTPLLSDSEDVEDYFNKGRIYRTKDNTNDESADSTEILFIKNKIPPRISGNTMITFGLVLDNVYAPNAVARIEYSDQAEDYIDLSDNPDAVTTGSSIDDYKNAENNKYFH